MTTNPVLVELWRGDAPGGAVESAHRGALAVVDADGRVIDGPHPVEPTAFHIHSRIHLAVPSARCVLHTHMPYATALTVVAGGRLEMCEQNALRFHGRIAYDDLYNGLALDSAEGDRIAAALGDRPIGFLASHGVVGLMTLGAVFLAVTGAEALYADLGHFGRKPIQTAWFALVLPALAANYLGQGALVLADPKAIENPFFLLYPDWALLPVVAWLSPALINVVTGSAVVEQVFGIPGMGRYFVQGALNRDYTLVLGVVLVVGALIVLINALVDALRGWLDPRLESAAT